MNLSGPAEKDEKFSEPHGRVLEIMNVEIVRVVVTTFQSHRDQSSRAEVVPPSVLITHKSAGSSLVSSFLIIFKSSDHLWGGEKEFPITFHVIIFSFQN